MKASLTPNRDREPDRVGSEDAVDLDDRTGNILTTIAVFAAVVVVAFVA